MNTTKNIRYLNIDEGLLNAFCDSRYRTELGKIQDIYRQLRDKVNAIADKWIKVDGEDFFIFTNGAFKVLIPDTRKMQPTLWQFGSDRSVCNVLENMKSASQDDLDKWEKAAISRNAVNVKEFADTLLGLPARGITRFTARTVFQQGECPLYPHRQGIIMRDGRFWTEYIITCENDYTGYNVRTDNAFAADNYLGAQLSIHEFLESETLFDIGEKYGIIPHVLNTDEKRLLRELSLLYKDGVRIDDINSLKTYIINSNREELLGYSFDYHKIKKEILDSVIDIRGDSELSIFFRQYLNEYDFHRARVQPYRPRWYLSDEGKGHWELWSMGEPAEQTAGNEEDEESSARNHTVYVKGGVIARNPLSDIRYDAVVGIDFGTKSTIVAVLDENDNIIPLRVGIADYLEKPRKEHYENPTVMQFIDLNAFLEAYNAKSGRPYTSWDDLKISHEAFKNMINARESREYTSFMSNLKQWAGGQYGNHDMGHLIIRDRSGNRCDVRDYASLTREDMDPVELYAYYLGIFINNMHTGIYLDYLMSFPETFSLEVKEHLLSSFQKGIRRSLPESIFDNEEAKAAFRVRQGPSEPAAYAACALEQYGILPDDNGVFYGIFDFGGGTTDFDFGTWKNAPEDEVAYDYVISHFCSGGDKSLGGENLLELLAYHVFCDNTAASAQDTTNLQLMRNKKLVFSRPPEGKIVPGTEAMISQEESAMLNTKQLMEVLRPFWEESENLAITARLNLFDESGTDKVAVELKLDEEVISQILDQRIEQGVRNFFEALHLAYTKHDICTKKPIHIFLAGNSSRSARVTRLFEQYMQEYGILMFETQKETPHFLLFPPLGSKEAAEIQRENGIEPKEEDLMAPTGKTGVAFGMLMCRENSGIKVESQQKKTEQIKFGYYIGVNSRKCFKTVFDRTAEYHKWHVFRKASDEMETFEFYYTELPEVLSGNIAIKNNPSIHRKKCLTDKSREGAFIFFRFTSPTSLEYVVADEEGIEEETYISSIYKVNL